MTLAHLANFAYDPINYEFIDRLNLIEFFLDILHMHDNNSKEFEFALGGICNL